MGRAEITLLIILYHAKNVKGIYYHVEGNKHFQFFFITVEEKNSIFSKENIIISGNQQIKYRATQRQEHTFQEYLEPLRPAIDLGMKNLKVKRGAVTAI